MRPEDRLQELRTELTISACTANRDRALAFALALQDALDSHELVLTVANPTPDRPVHSDRKPRAFPARYRGRCALCNGQIEVDDMIVRAASPRTGMDHQRCADQEPRAGKCSPIEGAR